MRGRVADFGLSREELDNKNVSNIRGTFGYLDPEYISTRTFTKKSDVYSYGLLLFELITGRSPLQGLMNFVDLAAMNNDGKVGWEEIVDWNLDGKFDMQEVNNVAALAYKCVDRVPRKRHGMRDVVQVLSRILKMRSHIKSLSATPENVSDKPNDDDSISMTMYRECLHRAKCIGHKVIAMMMRSLSSGKSIL